jgi:hypothetical protein
MNEQPRGRYFPQELELEQDAEVRGRTQEALDAGERKEWRLVGVSDLPPERHVVLFWDTARPSFGRSTSH